MLRDALLRYAARLTRQYRLAAPARLVAGPAGTRLATTGGQSIDFHDYREYQPGDDLRRVDWRAYARTGSMHLKLFRDEVSPTVEITLDPSASMGAYPGKGQAAVFVAAFVAGAARAAGGRPVLRHAGGRHTGADLDACLAGFDFAGPDAHTDAPVERAAADRPWRVLIGDFLTPDGGAATFARQASGALTFTPIMLLAQTEREPDWPGGRHLVDVEAPGRTLDVVATPTMRAQYRERLTRHENQLAADALRHGGTLLTLTAPDGDLSEADLDALAKALADAGLVTAGENP